MRVLSAAAGAERLALPGTPVFYFQYVCPMSVKPSDIILYARQEVINRSLIGYDIIRQFRELFGHFQRVRWHMSAQCRSNIDVTIFADKWQEWLETSVMVHKDRIIPMHFSSKSKTLREAEKDSSVSSSLICCECSNSSPVCYE